jgi:Domain of unknown function (DUF4263)
MPPRDVTAGEAASYLSAYASVYQGEHQRLTPTANSASARRCGFPPIVESPYLGSGFLSCLLAEDGAVVIDQSRQPPPGWEIAGGPAMMVDYADPASRVPPEIVNLLKKQGINRQSIGIYRICFAEPPSVDTWRGTVPQPTDRVTVTAASGLRIEVSEVDLSWETLVERLTFGAYGPILDLQLPEPTTDFWQPRIIRDLGFLTADRKHSRFFHYLELLRHVDAAAWDERAIWARAKLDVRRDLLHGIAKVGKQGGGAVSFGHDTFLLDAAAFRDRLRAFEEAINGLERLLNEQPDADEEVFQRYLTEHPLVLDVYREVVPKPNFVYPEDASPLGKAFVQPDFLVRRHPSSYRLIELERPSKGMATKKGQSRAEVTQAVFQIAEFKDYVLEHYDRLRDDYPGINRNCTTAVIVSRSREESFGGRADVRRQLQLLQEQHSIDELLTYDDLLVQAKGSGAPFRTVGRTLRGRLGRYACE